MEMDDGRLTPWPEGWPPLWRGVLEVIVGTGVGNIVASAGGLGIAAGLKSGGLGKGFGAVLAAGFLAGLLIHVVVVLVVVIPITLEGLEDRFRWSMVKGFSLGVCVINGGAIVGSLAVFASMTSRMVDLGVFVPFMFLLPLGFLANLAAGWCLPEMSQRRHSRRVTYAWVAGGTLSAVGVIWLGGVMVWLSTRRFLLPGWAGNAFTVLASALVFFPLSFAVSATILAHSLRRARDEAEVLSKAGKVLGGTE